MDRKNASIHLFFCASSYEQSEISKAMCRQDVDITFIPLPCSGKLDILYLTKAFETGADAVAVMICPDGDCRYIEGNSRAKKRIEAVAALLGETGFSAGRIAFIQMDGAGAARAIGKLEEFCRRIEREAGRAPANMSAA